MQRAILRLSTTVLITPAQGMNTIWLADCQATQSARVRLRTAVHCSQEWNTAMKTERTGLPRTELLCRREEAVKIYRETIGYFFLFPFLLSIHRSYL